MKRLFDIGYGNDSPPEFLRRLKAAGISVVIDVRREGSSSWCRAYAMPQIEQWMDEEGITYSEHSELANAFESLPEYTEWLNTRDGGYIASCTSALIEVLWSAENVCLLCAENPGITDKGFPRCHRVILADALLEDLGDEWIGEHL